MASEFESSAHVHYIQVLSITNRKHRKRFETEVSSLPEKVKEIDITLKEKRKEKNEYEK